MTCATARLYYVIPTLGTLCGLGRSQGVYSTRVAPAVDEHMLGPCQYELTIPRVEAAIRAVWVIFDRGPEVLNLYNDRDVFRFAEKERLALLLSKHCRSKERQDIDVRPEEGIGRALFTALDQLRQSSKHGELSSSKVIVLGFLKRDHWSGGCRVLLRIACWRAFPTRRDKMSRSAWIRLSFLRRGSTYLN